MPRPPDPMLPAHLAFHLTQNPFSDWDELQANSLGPGPAPSVAARGAAAAPPLPVAAPRYNIFDGDEFDVFSTGRVDLSRVHRGKKRQVLLGPVYLSGTRFLLNNLSFS